MNKILRKCTMMKILHWEHHHKSTVTVHNTNILLKIKLLLLFMKYFQLSSIAMFLFAKSGVFSNIIT